ncbi:MAG: 50S ribosomal protein L4 [Candidatus Gracilibacteria bacterium]|nr:50S ribosomal protein L4 [Candidatus Gracilibacteria bacterium]
METKLLNQEGKEIGTIELNDGVFGIDVNEGLIHRALVYQQSNARQVVAHTKTRAEVRGSTRKIFKQKGTGQARAGGNRSPIRIGGGVAFGPRNTVNFVKAMNKKERRLALCSILSSKVKSNNVLVLDTLSFSEIKTKNMVNVLNAIPYTKNVLLALASRNEVIEKSARNLPKIKTLTTDYLNIHDLLKYTTLVLLKDGVEKLNTIR